MSVDFDLRYKFYVAFDTLPYVLDRPLRRAIKNTNGGICVSDRYESEEEVEDRMNRSLAAGKNLFFEEWEKYCV